METAPRNCRFLSLVVVELVLTHTMRAEILAYMIYSEGPESPEYVMHIFQDHGKGGLSLGGGVAVMTETAMTAETAKTVKTATVTSFCCIL